MKIETLAVHAGRHSDPATGAVAQPIYLSTTYERETDGSYPRGFEYSREGNPNRAALETCLTALEGGQAGLLEDVGDGDPPAEGAGKLAISAMNLSTCSRPRRLRM